MRGWMDRSGSTEIALGFAVREGKELNRLIVDSWKCRFDCAAGDAVLSFRVVPGTVGEAPTTGLSNWAESLQVLGYNHASHGWTEPQMRVVLGSGWTKSIGDEHGDAQYTIG